MNVMVEVELEMVYQLDHVDEPVICLKMIFCDVINVAKPSGQ